jgi:hypothetical protein
MNATFLETSRLGLYKNVENFTKKAKFEKFSSLFRVLLVKFLKEPDI